MGNYRHIHFIGIGGIGMSALARYFLHEGKEVSGSDIVESENTKMLKKEGADVVYVQRAENITHEGGEPLPDLVVYTEAMEKDHPELLAARALDIKTMNYFDALGMVVNQYYLIAVAGVHGKTTTAAMLTDVLEEGGLDPTAIIGSLRSKTGSNFRAGESKYAVVEACEYRRDFLSLEPSILVITNIEAEHLDYYKDLKDIQDAFKTLAEKVPEDGFIICNPKDKNVAPILRDVKATIIDYTKFFDPVLVLHALGMFNRMNAAAALGVASVLGVNTQVSKDAVADFSGTWRRGEYIGKTDDGALIYDDYAHHPTEVTVTIQAFKEEYPKQRLVVVFQPHLYSRTQAFFADFVDALRMADEVILAPIHEARKETDHNVSSEKLAEAIGEHAKAFDSYEDITTYLIASAKEEDVVLTMGAGAIYKVAQNICVKK